MNLLELFAPIRTFVFDVDGVLTDGSLLLTADGDMLRSMNINDCYAMQHAIKKGYNIWILSRGNFEGVRLGLNGVGVQEVHVGIENKKEFLEQRVTAGQISYESILYMGDDIPDYAAMQLCGLPCCPNDATAEVRQVAKYISPKGGGKGCVRDVIEKVMKLNSDWELPV
jgi:3-deoxy-D-manno-octulosonate 8-phosphate phosphatase (KDO 8-P phosphatase)